MKPAALSISLIFCLSSCRQHVSSPNAAGPVPVRLTAIEQYEPSGDERYSASIIPNRQVNLAFKTSGFVESLHQVPGVNGHPRSVDLGDLVSRGTQLARVRTQDYRLQVSQVQGQVQQARASQQAVAAQAAQAQAAALKAAEDFSRADALYAKKSLTKSDYDAAKANRDATQAQLEAAQSQQQASTGALHASEALLGTATLGLDDTALSAPFTGVIIQRSIDIGSLAGPGTLAFVLADVSFVKATFAVSDLAVVALKKGSRLTTNLEAFPGRAFTGYVSAIGAAADANTRSFQVEVTIPNPSGTLRPGMVASLSLGTPRAARPVLVAPLDAIVPGENGVGPFAVLAVVNGVAHRKPVTLGATYGDRIAVSGLAAGDKIVSSGAAFASDGEAVTVIP